MYKPIYIHSIPTTVYLHIYDIHEKNYCQLECSVTPVLCRQEKHDENKSGGVNGGEQRDGSRPGSVGGLEKLTREELVTKCRQLLTLAQKAKAAKDGNGIMQSDFPLEDLLCVCVSPQSLFAASLS